MVDITKPIYGEIWANSGEKLSPGTDKIATGWIQEMMPYQYENFLQNRTDVAISYLLQKGIPEWSADQEYIANKSVVTYSGQLYLATATSTNVLPIVAASWRRLTLTFGANGTIPVAFGGTGATNAADARTNLGIGSAATVNLPASNGVVVKLADNSLVARTISGTSGYITVSNGDGVAGNPTITVGTNVAKTDQDAAWTTKTSIKIPTGTTAERGVGAPGRIRFNIETGVYEGYDNTGWSPIGSNGTMDVQDFQGDGTTTSFTLSSTPRAENNTQVFFNGIYQQKNSYELVGNSLVFDEAPAADISVEVVTIASVAIGTTTAQQTSIVDSGNYYSGSNVESALQQSGFTLSKAVLSYNTYVEAEAAAATLPNAQRVVAPNVDGLTTEYSVTSGDLVETPSNNFQQTGIGAIAMPIIKKSRQWIHNEDFNFLPASGDVTEQGLNLFAEAKARKMPVHLASGRFKVSGALDPAGIEVIGTLGGWRNANGTIIEGSGNHHAFEQIGSGLSQITYSLKNVHVENALSALKVGYGAFVTAEHLTALNVQQGILLGDSTILGNLWNVFRQCNINAVNEALVITGRDFANANLFDSCFLSGGAAPVSTSDYVPAVRVAGGGYGALATTFLNTEIAGPGIGAELGLGSSTVFINPYFESKASSIALNGNAGKVKIVGGIFGSANNTHPTPASFIWHKSSSAHLEIDGPQVFLDQSDGKQNNMSFISSDIPANLTVSMQNQPRVSNSVGSTGWKLFGTGLPNNLGYMNFGSSYTSEFTAASGTQPSLGAGTLSASYERSGKSVHVDIELTLGTGGSFTGDNWLLLLPFAATRRAVGNLRVFRSGTGVKSGICSVNASSNRLSLYLSGTDFALGGGVPWAWQAGDVLTASIDYSI